jgi:mannose-6-phosphate isomerase
MIKELSPSIVRKIWGGKKLEIMKCLRPSNGVEPIGETLEIYEESLPYLAKFIDTNEELSVQVHPGDEYARLHENSLGKTECWIILEASEGAGVYLGLKPYVTKELLKDSLKQKKEINHLLNFYPVKKGDFFYVTAGSIHAIGKNITLAEVQQNSGITYRVWDWDRVDEKGMGRELHIDKSLDVINFEKGSNSSDFFRIRSQIFENDGLNELCQHPQFHLFLLNLKKGHTYQKNLSHLNRPSSVLNLEGKVLINEKSLDAFSALLIDQESILTIEALDDGSLLLIF